MKICVINSLYPPFVRGGAEVVAQEDVARHRAKGDDVFVITVKPWGGWRSLCARLENQQGVRVYRFYPLNIFSFITIDRHSWLTRIVWHFMDFFNLQSYFCIKKILQKEQPDLVVSHNVKGLGYLTWSAIRHSGCRYQQVMHDVQLAVPSGLLHWGQEKKLSGSVYRLYAALCRRLIGSPGEVICPSQWLMDFYTSRGFFPRSKKTVSVAFGALPPITPLSVPPNLDTLRLVYVGQMAAHKGIEWLIHALQEGLRVQWTLDIVGDGPRLGAVQTLAAADSRLRVHGRLDGAARDEVIRAGQITVVPSLVYENSPTIIPFSLSLGRPVLAATIGGIPEMIAPGVNGWLFRPGDKNDFLRCLIQMISG
ncbi:glycosyltransferase [Candidatus Falkowbacteria bacterium]|nr:glycosyltransferase [Candidatus Falkowbacteria bacterium]